MKMKRKGLVVLLALWVVGILFPMAWASGRSPVMNLWFERIFSPPWMHVVMHAGLYAVLAVMGAMLARQFGWPLYFGLAGVLVIGILQEVIQTALAGRAVGGGELFDLGVDLSGGLLGLLAVFAVEILRKRRSN